MSNTIEKSIDLPKTRSEVDLARANAVLIESVRRLASTDDTGRLLDCIVEQVAQLVSARCVFLLEYDSGPDTLALLRTWLDGKMFVGPRGDELELYSKPFPANITGSWKLMCSDRAMVTGSGAANLGVSWPGAADFMARIGATDCGRIALFIGDEPVGCLAFAVSDNRELPVNDRELVEAISRQAAVAVKLVKQADYSQSAAISRERELSAREKAATLQRLNEILLRGAESIDRVSELREVASGFLLEAKRNVGAFYAAAFRSLEGTTHVPIAVIVGETSFSDEEVKSCTMFDGFQERSAEDPFGLFAKLALGKFVAVRIHESDAPLCKETLEYHRSLGNQVVWNLPIMLRGKSCGYVALGLQRDAIPSEAEREQLLAIQMHLSLAFEIQRLATQVEKATIVEERNRLARDIHDMVAHSALGIILHLEAVSESPMNDPIQVKQTIDLVLQLARRSLDDARQAIGVLRGDVQSSTDLAMRLASVVREVNSESGDSLDVSFECSTIVPILARERIEQIVRIVAEAVLNAKLHANASSIAVRLAKAEKAWTIHVTDNGCGFDPTAHHDGRYGLLGMKERARSVDCSLIIESKPGSGTSVTLSWPL
ncbi:MAG: GAF domain-containing sensor histidine kinase [Pirellula sp.]